MKSSTVAILGAAVFSALYVAWRIGVWQATDGGDAAYVSLAAAFVALICRAIESRTAA